MGVSIMLAIPWVVSLLALCLCAVIDLRNRIIPDELVILIALSGLALSLTLRADQIWISVPAAMFVLVSLGVLAHFDLLGGGDVKLMAALTLLVPPEGIGSLLIGIVLAGGVLGCLYLAARHVLLGRAVPQGDRAGLDRPESRLGRLVRREYARIEAGEPMPYGLAILGGVVCYVARELPQCLSAISCSL